MQSCLVPSQCGDGCAEPLALHESFTMAKYQFGLRHLILAVFGLWVALGISTWLLPQFNVPFLSITYMGILLVTAFVLLARYRATRRVGYLLLFVAFPAWPLLSTGFRHWVQNGLVDGLFDGKMTFGELIILMKTIRGLLVLSAIISISCPSSVSRQEP